jgi:polar amino acid transport system substrate-binding protein
MTEVLDQDISASIKELAPLGTLRAAVNLGNSVLAQPGENGADPRGVTVDLARELARRAGLPLQFALYDAAGHVFAAAEKAEWDVAFLAIEPERAKKVSFSPPYLTLEGTYLVHDRYLHLSIADFDHPDARIAVTENAAYDLYLTRTLKHAKLVRASTPPAALQMFLDKKLDALAGVREILVSYLDAEAGLSILPDQFSSIQQAVGVPVGRPLAAAFVHDFVTNLKTTTFVRDALMPRSPIVGASISRS